MPKKKRTSPPRPRVRPRRTVEIRHTPGMADAMMRELAPLLAEEGIDLETTDLDGVALQQALNRAVERYNLALFTPVGARRDLATALLRRAVEAMIEGEIRAAVAILDQAVPQSPDNSTAEVSSCIGAGLGLLDAFLGGPNAQAPAGLARQLAPFLIRGPGDRAVRDILKSASLGRAFDSLNTLMSDHAGPEVHYGSAIALAAVIRAWSHKTNAPTADLIRDHIR